jgi:hypothetical protein
MNCPNCGSDELYRKHPQDLKVWCDRCGYCFKEQQPQQPILSKQVWKSKRLRGSYYITVWHCRSARERYSFTYCYGSSLPVQFNDFPDSPYLRGSYGTPQEALEAGIDEVYQGGA